MNREIHLENMLFELEARIDKIEDTLGRKQMNKDYKLMGEKEFFDVMKKINRRINNEQRYRIAKFVNEEILKDV